jgi:autotransporter-associated beta strand protein
MNDLPFAAVERPGIALPGRRRWNRHLAALLATTALVAVAALLPGAARAQNATWLASPGSVDFNTAANWNPAAVPTGTACFGTSTTTGLSFSTNTTIGGWTFNAGASNYTFTNVQTLGFIGAGIVINGGSATITNNNGLSFHNASSAGSAAITSSGVLDFFDSSTAGSAAITNNGGALMRFFNASTAGSANITNNGEIAFNGTTSAVSATITTNSGGQTFIANSASGGTARFILNGTGVLDISVLATAGTTAGSIEGAGNVFLGSKNLAVGGNNLPTTFSGVIQDGGIGGGTGGSLTKTDTDTLVLTGTNTYTGGTTILAGTLQLGDAFNTGKIIGAVVNNNLFSIVNADTRGITSITNNGVTVFSSGTSASSAAITNNNTLEFFNTSTAGSATITTNTGGQTFIANSASGGTARFILNGTGFLDISVLAGGGTTAGSIEGNGNVFLGAKNLTVGGNNLSTTFSGVIQDGGNHGGTGGSLTKTGFGTLILTGANTYTGGTTITAGTIQVGNNTALGTGALTLNGGTLQAGTGIINLGNAVRLGTGGGTVDTATHAMSFSGNITDGGATPGPLTFISTGGLGGFGLSGNNTYSAATVITSGSFVDAFSTTALSANSDFTVNGLLGLAGFNNTIRSLSGTGTVGSAGTSTLTIAIPTGQQHFEGF